MIRQLAECPYCNGCEIALDDCPDLVFNPGGTQQPCPHLAWVDGRYTQWDHSARGTSRVIGSTEFRWAPDLPGTEEMAELLPYLRELVNSGPGWPFAPPEPFAAHNLCAELTATDARGRPYTLWDVDGWGVFARDPGAFWASLHGCQERQLAALEVEEGAT
jgi:hypothetical protein